MKAKWTALILTLVAGQVSAEPVKTWKPAIGDRADIEAATAMLAQASKEVRAGRASFKVTCVDRRQSPSGVTCDGVSLLSQIDLRRIHQVTADEEPVAKSGANRGAWTQMVFFDVGGPRNRCGGVETLLFEITHGPGRTSRAVRAIEITRDRIC